MEEQNGVSRIHFNFPFLKHKRDVQKKTSFTKIGLFIDRCDYAVARALKTDCFCKLSYCATKLD